MENLPWLQRNFQAAAIINEVLADPQKKAEVYPELKVGASTVRVEGWCKVPCAIAWCCMGLSGRVCPSTVSVCCFGISLPGLGG